MVMNSYCKVPRKRYDSPIPLLYWHLKDQTCTQSDPRAHESNIEAAAYHLKHKTQRWNEKYHVLESVLNALLNGTYTASQLL